MEVMRWFHEGSRSRHRGQGTKGSKGRLRGMIDHDHERQDGSIPLVRSLSCSGGRRYRELEVVNGPRPRTVPESIEG